MPKFLQQAQGERWGTGLWCMGAQCAISCARKIVGAHEEIYPLHAVLGNHLINTNRHGLKFDYVMGNGMHEWTQVLILPVY